MSKRQKIRATIFDKRGKQLSTAVNSYTCTHPLQAALASRVGLDEKVYLHAEIKAIIRLKKNADKAYRILIERFDRKGKPVLAKPCPICQLAIEESEIKVVEYTR